MHSKRQGSDYFDYKCSCGKPVTDYGSEPFVVNIEKAVCNNANFRTALWTGENLQLTLMSIPRNGEIGVEVHNCTDQFIRLESGKAVLIMGECKEKMNYHRYIGANDAVFVPAGTWHNIINVGNCPLKLYSVYAPPKHPYGTVHMTKEEAETAER